MSHIIHFFNKLGIKLHKKRSKHLSTSHMIVSSISFHWEQYACSFQRKTFSCKMSISSQDILLCSFIAKILVIWESLISYLRKSIVRIQAMSYSYYHIIKKKLFQIFSRIHQLSTCDNYCSFLIHLYTNGLNQNSNTTFFFFIVIKVVYLVIHLTNFQYKCVCSSDSQFMRVHVLESVVDTASLSI